MWVLNLEETKQVQGNHNTWSNPETSDGMGHSSLQPR